MKTISFFNNKGGVGKTTLACNLASHFVADLGAKVLLLDCDPQCNATLLVLGEDKVAPIYWPDIAGPSDVSTIHDVIKGFEIGEVSVNTSVKVERGVDNRFGVDILPGHPRLSVVEDHIAQAWREAMGGEVGGLRRTNWCTTLLESVQADYDYAFIDLGPSLGSLNRSCLIASDYFVAPLGADIFSLIGLRNIAEWLSEWSKRYSEGYNLCAARHAATISQFNLPAEVRVLHGFLGYTVQAYIAKYKEGEKRPTKAYEAIAHKIPAIIDDTVQPFLPADLDREKAHLGEVPHMYSMVPLAQSVNAPIRDLQSKDGLVGSHYSQAARYKGFLEDVAMALSKNIESLGEK